MTMDEKREVLDKHCIGRACEECALSWQRGSHWCGHHVISECSEKELDEGLKLIGKLPTEPTEPTEPKEDVVNHPNHYTNGGMECIDEMVLIFGKSAVMNFCLCNAWKYRRRALYKNKEEDMQKSHWYINKYKELKERQEKKWIGSDVPYAD